MRFLGVLSRRAWTRCDRGVGWFWFLGRPRRADEGWRAGIAGVTEREAGVAAVSRSGSVDVEVSSTDIMDASSSSSMAALVVGA